MVRLGMAPSCVWELLKVTWCHQQQSFSELDDHTTQTMAFNASSEN